MKKSMHLNEFAGLWLAVVSIFLSCVIAFPVYAAVSKTVGDYGYDVYDDNGDGEPESILITKYSGSGTQVIVPGTFTDNGKTYPTSSGAGEIVLDKAFQNNTGIQKIALSNGIGGISNDAFTGCTSLTEIAIGDSVEYVGSGVFAGLPNLKTYYFSGKKIEYDFAINGSGIGQDMDGKTYSGITVYTTEGSLVDTYIKSVNEKNKEGYQINLVYDPDPYSKHTVKPDPSSGGGSGSGSSGSSGSSGGSGGSGSGGSGSGGSGSGVSGSPTIPRVKQKGTDGTYLGKGAAEEAATKYLSTFKKESDPAGSVVRLLQLKASKVKKTSLKLSWKKVGGAKKYVIYGNNCGVKYNYVKQLTTKKTSVVIKKIGKKKLKKGTYYKFIVIALDRNNNVLSTSKTVHAATSGGKFGNAKSITTLAKKNKVTVKVKKSFKLGAKEIPASQKLKVKRHRPTSYESSNKKIATVSSKGVIKGKKKGTCYVYVYAQIGICKKIKVTVK